MPYAVRLPAVVRRRGVKVDRPKRSLARVDDLVQLAFFDDEQRARLKFDAAQLTATFADLRFAGAGDDEQPLFAAAVLVAWFVVARAAWP